MIHAWFTSCSKRADLPIISFGCSSHSRYCLLSSPWEQTNIFTMRFCVFRPKPQSVPSLPHYSPTPRGLGDSFLLKGSSPLCPNSPRGWSASPAHFENAAILLKRCQYYLQLMGILRSYLSPYLRGSARLVRSSCPRGSLASPLHTVSLARDTDSWF